MAMCIFFNLKNTSGKVWKKVLSLNTIFHNFFFNIGLSLSKFQMYDLKKALSAKAIDQDYSEY